MCLQELIHESLAILHRNKMVSIDHHRWLDQPLLNSQQFNTMVDKLQYFVVKQNITKCYTFTTRNAYETAAVTG